MLQPQGLKCCSFSKVPLGAPFVAHRRPAVHQERAAARLFAQAVDGSGARGARSRSSGFSVKTPEQTEAWDDSDITADERVKYAPNFNESVDDEGADWDPAADSFPDDVVKERLALKHTEPCTAAGAVPKPSNMPRSMNARRFLPAQPSGPQAAALASFDDSGSDENEDSKGPQQQQQRSRQLLRSPSWGPQSQALASFAADDGDGLNDHGFYGFKMPAKTNLSSPAPALPRGIAEAEEENEEAEASVHGQMADASYDDDDAFDWREKDANVQVPTNMDDASLGESFDEEDYKLFLAALQRKPTATKEQLKGEVRASRT